MTERVREAEGASGFGIGSAVRRPEDAILLTGRGRYTDDVTLPGQAHAVMARARHAHGDIRLLDTQAALASPGVLAVFTGADLEAGGFGPLTVASPVANRDGTPVPSPARPALATKRVRHLGEPVAVVVAETAIAAKDAAELVEVEIDPLPALVDPRAALAPGAPCLHPELPGNLVIDFHYGDQERVAAAFAAAAHRVKLELVSSRIVVNPMEPRAAVGAFDPATGRWTLHVGSQGAFGMRASLAKFLDVAVDKVRVLTGHVGGSFGMKAGAFPEYAAVLFAARALGRPVKWTDERSESFLSDLHGRDHVMTAELALDPHGRFLAVRLDGVGNGGAYPQAPIPITRNAVKNTVSLYRTPLLAVTTRVACTNTAPVGPYRGAGRPEGNYYMERLIEAAARQIGVDAVELRRRNHIPPGAMPFTAASGMVYDGGDFTTILDKALDAADWTGFEARRTASAKRGLLRGRGIGNYLEVTAPPGKEMGGILFEADGTVTMVTGTLDYGQGHWAPFAQLLVHRLGLPFESIRLSQGDSDALVAGGGTGGSRSIMASGSALWAAADQVIAKGRRIAAHLLEAAEADIGFANGRFAIVGTDRGIGLLDLAASLRRCVALPPDLPTNLDVADAYDDPPAAYPNGAHVCEVEVDPETGITRVVRYHMVNDFGTLVNPLMVAGQAHGGVAQGIGQALYERVVHDDQGQLLTGSFMDYCLPRAADLPDFAFASHPVPDPNNPLGAKGCGEAGCAGSLPAVMNALLDALAPVGVDHIDMPATPERVWRAIRAARTG